MVTPFTVQGATLGSRRISPANRLYRQTPIRLTTRSMCRIERVVEHIIRKARTMAQQTTVTLTDDLDGGRAAETVSFGLDGRVYEIDLSKKNAAAFRRKLAPFLEHARKAGRGRRHRPGRTAASRDRSGGIRAWAKGQGIAVSERGRIPASVVEQYEAATTGR